MASSEESSENLSKLFQSGLDLFNKVSKTEEPTNSFTVQREVKKAMETLERATMLVSVADLFSTNETIDEIATDDLRYLLLPALLGSLTLKLTSGDRKEIVEVAEVYFKDYLQRCNSYELSDYIFKEQDPAIAQALANKTEMQQIKDMVLTRQNKIHRYRAQKELESKLEDLKRNMDNENVDDEIKRSYFLTMIRQYIYQAVDEISSIEAEKPILLHMQQMKESEKKNPSLGRREPPRSRPLRPVIITRDQAQKAVYGLGYPSLPTMTVQEFYDKRVRDGVFPDPAAAPAGPASLQAAMLAGLDLNAETTADLQREARVEADDPDTLDQMRRMDEFKDEHRRGWGNRANRS